MRLAPGTRLGPYEIRSVLGEGGMGEVYRSYDTRLAREVAVKVLRAADAPDPDRVRRFEQEARAASALSHPHVCAVYDVGLHDGAPYVVLELLEGESLRAQIARGPLPLRRVLELGAQAADALAAAHAKGIVHRDLKPENLFVTTAGALKVLDFGLAKLTQPDAAAVSREAPSGIEPTISVDRPGSLVGTGPYMSPEQVRGDAVDARADLFALGVVLHEALAGRRPFEGASAFAVLHAILHEEPEPLAALRPEAPAPLARLVRRCLAKDAERRAQTAKEVRNELDEIARELELAPARRGEGERPPGNPVARSLPLTASHVRHLSVRNPRLVGHPLTWSDNGVGSDVLLVLLHGIGSDDGPFEPVLRASPWRTVAPTLVGFAREEAQRPALGIDDHSRLLRVLLRELVAELEPATTILVGHSAGADQFLRMIHDEAGGGAGIEVDGLLALGPNVDLGTCFASRHYASLDAARPEGTLALLKTLGAGIESLSTWLVVHAYFASTFMKLGEELEPLRRYAIDLVAPFERPGDPLALWYRTARRRVPHLRLVFSNEESAAAEALLGRHLESNVLGDDFVESSFVFEPVHHLGLLEPERLLGHVEALLGGARGR